MSGQQLDLGVEAAQFEVVGGQLGVQSEIDVGHVGGAGLGVGAGGFDGAADAAPEIRLPARLAGELKVVVSWCVAPDMARGRFAETLSRRMPRPAERVG